MNLRGLGALAGEAVGAGWATVKVATSAGLIEPIRPDRLVAMVGGYRHWGMTPAAICAINAARDPHRLAVIDEREAVTYAEVDARSSIVAAALGERGVTAGDAVAVLARNSSGFVVAQAALCKLGADILYLNTGFAGPQVAEILRRESAVAVIADDEFGELLDEVAGSLPRLVSWVEDGSAPPDSFTALVAGGHNAAWPALPSPGRASRQVIMTSGTTGAPKGAAHHVPGPLVVASGGVAMFEAIPYRAKETTVLAAPAFHSWGLGNLLIGMLLQSTFVMTRRFEPATTLALVEAHAASTLVAVPVMCQRMLDAHSTADTSSLRVVALSGSALAPSLASHFMDRFGDVLYSLYGSTEVAYVSVAGPRDLREAPHTAGRILRGVKVRLVDDNDDDVPPGEVGRIFAGSGLSFDGYTSGEDKARLSGLASTGDVGRIGPDGRLYVEGRDDDMIVSGGENVFPGEVEESLLQHPAVSDAAVVGVPDESYGQALVAHVVLRSGQKASAKQLRDHVKSRLANYKVPRDVVFHDELPRNETGKVLRRVLTEPGGSG